MREKKLRKLYENLDERSKVIESSSTTNEEAIEFIKMMSKEIDTTVKDVEQGTSFIELGERDKLLPLRELEGLDKQLRIIKGSLKVTIAKRIDIEGWIENKERKLNEIQDPSYSDDQRNMIEDRIRTLRGGLTERNEDVEQGTSFIELGERDKLLPLRELEGLDKQLRIIKGSLKVTIAKRIDIEGWIENKERKLNEIQDPSYSDDQRNMIEDRIRTLRGGLTERNEEIDILKGEASKQINQIRRSIMKFLDKESGMLGERIRNLYKEQGIMIVSILITISMAIGVLIEAVLGGPSHVHSYITKYHMLCDWKLLFRLKMFCQIL